MKCTPLVAAMAAGAFLSACAGIPPSDAPKTRVSADYEAAGDVSDVRAFVYGKRTVLEFPRRQLWVTVHDANGVTVPYEREGRFYRLSRKLDRFTVWANTRTVSFSKVHQPTVSLATQANVEQSADPATILASALDETKDTPVVVRAEREPADEAAALLRISARQLEEVRKAVATSASPAEAKVLNARLDRIESQLVNAAAAMIRVHFDSAATDFAPDSEVMRVLVPAAKAAERINVRGRTDAKIAGNADPRIALGRALAARTFLVQQGVDAHKIKVFALPAGDFIAPAGTVEGRALNRRVEIELVNRRYAELMKHTARLQEAEQ